MEWKRSDTLSLAFHKCTTCGGLGLVLQQRTGELAPCSCVLRSIFRICFARFEECADKDIRTTPVLDFVGANSRSRVWSRKEQEYMADFMLIARRTLDDLHFNVFRYYFLLRGNWQACCRRLHMDRGNFYHAVYRVEAKLGRAFRETEPYGLFPLDEYFNGATIRLGSIKPVESEEVQLRAGGPLRPPMAMRGEG